MVQFLYCMVHPLLSLTHDGTKLLRMADCQTLMFFDIMFAHCVWYDEVKMWHMFQLNTDGVEAHLNQAMQKADSAEISEQILWKSLSFQSYRVWQAEHCENAYYTSRKYSGCFRAGSSNLTWNKIPPSLTSEEIITGFMKYNIRF